MAQLNTSSKSGGQNRHNIHLDMTPMVDLAFLLLTFFVLTMKLNQTFVMPIETPITDTGQQKPVSIHHVLNLVLGDNDKLYYYQGETPMVKLTDFSAVGIRKVIAQKNKEIDKMVLLIKPSKASRYKNLVDALDEAIIAGVSYYIVQETSEDRLLIRKSNL